MPSVGSPLCPPLLSCARGVNTISTVALDTMLLWMSDGKYQLDPEVQIIEAEGGELTEEEKLREESLQRRRS